MFFLPKKMYHDLLALCLLSLMDKLAWLCFRSGAGQVINEGGWFLVHVCVWGELGQLSKRKRHLAPGESCHAGKWGSLVLQDLSIFQEKTKTEILKTWNHWFLIVGCQLRSQLPVEELASCEPPQWLMLTFPYSVPCREPGSWEVLVYVCQGMNEWTITFF